ncbi:MAG: hypothetical protein ACYC1D_13165 [Acidimicrobiales bacterium]
MPEPVIKAKPPSQTSPARRREPLRAKRAAPPLSNPEAEELAAEEAEFEDKGATFVAPPPSGANSSPRWLGPLQGGEASHRINTGIVAGVIVILVAAVVFLGLKVRSQDAQSSLRASAVATATTFGNIISSYNYNDPSSFTRAQRLETAAYAKTSASQAAKLTKLLIQYHGISHGKVLAAGLILPGFSSSHAGVLLFIDQTVTNSIEKTGTVDQPLRVEVSLTHSSGRWLVDGLTVPR